MPIPTFTIRTVKADGTLDQFLPDFESLGLSPQFSRAGTVVIKYPANGKNFSLLKDDTEIAVLMNGVEVGELRSIIESTDGNDADEAGEGSIWTFNARTWFSILDRAVVYPKAWPVRTPPTHDFVSATPGKVLGDLLTKAQSRGALDGLVWSFDATHDSAGNLWKEQDLDLSFDAGVKYSQVVQNLVDNGLIEVTTFGRVLQVYNKDGLGSDRSVGTNPLRFIRGRDLNESPRKSTTRELFTTALVAGDNNEMAEAVASNSTMSAWGRREAYYSQQGVIGNGMLTYIGGLYLDTVSRPIEEVTHQLFFDGPNNPVPVTDFKVGDWSLSDVGRGWERLRIKQWVVNVENSGSVTGSVVLNDLIAERIEKLNRKLESISSGITGAGASEQKDDRKAPAKVGGVVLGTDYYLQNGQPRAILTVDWSPVTTNADGTPISDLEGYRARWRYNGETTWRNTQVIDAGDTVAFFDNIDTDSGVQAQVVAYDRYNRLGAWSDIESISTAKDTAAPSRPAPPVVTSVVGTLRATWNGLDYQGNPMASDLAGVEVHVGPNGVFTPGPSTLKDFVVGRAATAVTITGLNYGQEYWVRLVAVDTSGNKSAGSDETSTSHAVMRQVVNVEIGTGEVGLGQVRFSDVGNLVEDGSFETTQLRVERQAQMSGTHMSFDNTTSSNGTWSFKVTGQNPWTPVEELTLQSGLPVKPGERIFGAADFKKSLDINASSTVTLMVRWYDKNGVLLNSSGNPGVFANDYYPLSHTDGVLGNNAWHNRVTGTSKVAPTNATNMSIGLRVLTHFGGTIWADGVEVRRQVDTLLISDAAITSAKIAHLAVNDAHIANASIGKLIAGTLNADMTVSSRIKTANSGARAEMNSGGFEAFNSVGTRTFHASSTGTVSLIGELKSGNSGRRIEINPGATGLAEIRLYPGSGANFAYINAIGDGSNVSLGLNSGSYTAGGTSTYNRLWLGDEMCRLETLKTDQSMLWGGFVSVNHSEGVIGRDVGNSTNSEMSFNGDGKIRFIGEVDYWADNNNAVMMGAASYTGGPYGGAGAAYGATQISTPMVTATIYDNNTSSGSGIGCNLKSRTTTGFDLDFTKVMVGTDVSIYWWAWRM